LGGAVTRRGVMRLCRQCDEPFEALKEYRGFSRSYCSRDCAAAARAARKREAWPSEEEMRRLYIDEGLSDLEVGKRFGRSYHWSFHVRRAYGIVGASIGDRATTHGRSRGESVIRRAFNINLKGEARCRNCRSSGPLNLHHAIPRSMSRAAQKELLNGLPLCVGCHMGWHRRCVVIYRDAFTEEEWAYLLTVEIRGQVTEVWLDQRYPDRGLPFKVVSKGRMA
jgi:hypothetical protein